MIIALVSENFNTKYPISINTKLAVITYLLRKHIRPVQIKRYLSTKHIAKAHYVIDLDTNNREIMDSLDMLLRCKNIEIESYKDYTSKYRLLDLFNGSVFRWPLSYSKYICNGLFNYLADTTPKEVSQALNPNNINKSTLGHYMRLLYDVRIKRTRNSILSKYIEEKLGNDSLSYYKFICNKYKINYNPGEYAKNKPIIDIIFDVLGDQSNLEHNRNTVVKLSNILEIGKCCKDATYYIVINGLQNVFIYSIYKHKYENNKTGRIEENILINVIAKKDTVSRSKIKTIKTIAKKRYPGLKIHTNIQWLRKR